MWFSTRWTCFFFSRKQKVDYVKHCTVNLMKSLYRILFLYLFYILQSGDKYEFLEKDRDESPEKEKKDNFPERFDKYDDQPRSVRRFQQPMALPLTVHTLKLRHTVYLRHSLRGHLPSPVKTFGDISR